MMPNVLRTSFLVYFILCLAAHAPICAQADEPVAPKKTISDEDMRFFENKVRPLLAEKCWSCHSVAKQKGSLQLDSLSARHQGWTTFATLQHGT